MAPIENEYQLQRHDRKADDINRDSSCQVCGEDSARRWPGERYDQGISIGEGQSAAPRCSSARSAAGPALVDPGSTPAGTATSALVASALSRPARGGSGRVRATSTRARLAGPQHERHRPAARVGDHVQHFGRAGGIGPQEGEPHGGPARAHYRLERQPNRGGVVDPDRLLRPRLAPHELAADDDLEPDRVTLPGLHSAEGIQVGRRTPCDACGPPVGVHLPERQATTRTAGATPPQECARKGRRVGLRRRRRATPRLPLCRYAGPGEGRFPAGRSRTPPRARALPPASRSRTRTAYVRR